MDSAVKDVVVLLPGLLGSVLKREDQEIWGLSGGAIFRAIFSGAGSVKSLTLKSDTDEDGVEATALLPDTHLIPGFWKVDGYSRVAQTLVDQLRLIPGANFFEFPYDWRRDNRTSAKKLAEQCARWLHNWRRSNGGSPDARLILVGHSMGGLVARYFLECLEGWKDTRALITFGTPHRGSLLAVQALAVGFRKDLGPVNLVDLSDMVRSFPSAYQLLPIYPCVQLPDGRKVRPGEAQGLGRLDPVRAAGGLAFQREIEQAIQKNSRDEKYLERGYHLYPVVGTYQPTLQGARVDASGAVEMLTSEPEGPDHGGDGTVPRVSALPLEERHQVRAMYNPTAHASLQNAFEVLTHVEGVISGEFLSLDTYRASLFGPAPCMLSLSLEDAFAHDEPVDVRVRPSVRTVSLVAYASNVETAEAFSVKLAPGEDGLHTGTLPPLPPGLYRLSVKGGPEVMPVSDVFAVFHRAGQLPEEPEKPVTLVVVPEAFVDPNVKRKFSEGPTVPGPAPAPALPAARGEGQSITRNPSLEPLGTARPGERLSVEVNLSIAEVGAATESAGVQFSGLAADWTELPVKVRLLCAEMTFKPGKDTGTVMVQRDDDSIAAVISGTVNAGASGELTLVATFEYQGRFCGAARRRVPIEETGAAAPGPSRGPVAPPGGGAVAASREGEKKEEDGGVFTIEAGARKPHLTVQIHRLDPEHPQRLYWTLQVGVPCEGLPSRLSGELNLGSDPAEFFQSIATTAHEQTAGDHYAWFLGLGNLLYERTPHAFREAFKALRQQYGAGFPIQFITDELHVPWELMAPKDVPGAELLCMEHPVARWYLDYQTSMTARLQRGDVLTVAPDYQFHSHLPPLPQAQEESRRLCKNFGAKLLAGRRKPILSLLRGGYPGTVGMLHFAGHGKYSANNQVSPSRVYLEDGDLQTLEVRNSLTMLGQRSRPLVIFNACEVGAAAELLGGIGGWAETFVSERFGGFIAPLWPVQDAHARDAVEQLVGGVLKEGLSVGESLRRLRAKEAKTSPTYLSYVYVGDVMAHYPPAPGG